MARYSSAPSGTGRLVPACWRCSGERGNDAALGWIAVCTRSGVCVPACPGRGRSADDDGCLARITALGGRGLPKQIEPQQDPDYFDRVRAFAELQLTDEERKEWT